MAVRLLRGDEGIVAVASETIKKGFSVNGIHADKVSEKKISQIMI